MPRRQSSSQLAALKCLDTGILNHIQTQSSDMPVRKNLYCFTSVGACSKINVVPSLQLVKDTNNFPQQNKVKHCFIQSFIVLAPEVVIAARLVLEY